MESQLACGSGQAFGLGNGAFQYLPTISSQGAGPGGVSNQILQTDDFNGDGYPDLVYRLQTGNIDTNINTKIVVLIYDPANRRYRELADASNLITLTPRAYGFYHDEALGMGDLNNDGVKEFFAFSRNNPNSGTPSRFSIYEQTGNVGNDASVLFRKTVIENPSFIPADQSISVLLGRADGTFSEQYGFTTATSSTNGLFVGDFNGDGVDDLTGLGGLKHNEAFIGKSKGLADIATGDINGDGRPDTVGVVAGLDRVKLLNGSRSLQGEEPSGGYRPRISSECKRSRSESRMCSATWPSSRSLWPFVAHRWSQPFRALR